MEVPGLAVIGHLKKSVFFSLIKQEFAIRHRIFIDGVFLWRLPQLHRVLVWAEDDHILFHGIGGGFLFEGSFCCFQGIVDDFIVLDETLRVGMISGPNAKTPEFIQQEAAEVGFFYSVSKLGFTNLQDIELYCEPICLIAPACLPISAQDRLRFYDLSGLDFVFPHDDCYAAVETLRRINDAGVQVGNVSYPGSMQLVLQKCLKAGAIMALPYSAALKLTADQELTILNIAEEQSWLYARILYQSRKVLSHAAGLLIDYSREYANELIKRDPEHFRKC